MKLHVVDTTLREGEQTPKVAFDSHTKVKIAKALCELGVDIIEVGIPAMGGDEVDGIIKIVELGLKSTLLTWNRLNVKDIEASLATGIKNVHICVPASLIHIVKKLRKTPEEIISITRRVVEYVVRKGCTVSLGAEDASRANEDYLFKLYRTALNAGATRLRYSDTMGVLNPFTTFSIIKRIKEELNADIEFHGHNDFGMATANTFAAVKAGACYIDCSINGLGERAGHTALEEIIMALMYMEDCRIDIRTDKLLAVSKLVEKYSGRPVGPGKPIVGDEVFFHESGIHVDGLLKDINTYQYLDPSLLGRSNKFVLGKHSGKAARRLLKKKKAISE